LNGWSHDRDVFIGVEKWATLLAREILLDWDAIVAFVANRALPPTKNEAERAYRDRAPSQLRHPYPRVQRCTGGTLSVIETKRRGNVAPWSYITDVLARAHTNQNHIPIPAAL